MTDALGRWLNESLEAFEKPRSPRQEGYKEALLHVKEFIAQETEIMDYEAKKES